MGDDWIKRLDRAARKRDGLERPEPIPTLNLKSLRETVGLTQTELAERLSMSRSSISYIERSGNKCSIENLIAFANGCGGQIEFSFHSSKECVFKIRLDSASPNTRNL